MNIKNRIVDVKQLRCNVLQDYLKMIIKPGWQKELYLKAKDQVENNGKYKIRYTGAYEKMRDYGVDNYMLENMDETIIIEILEGCPHIVSIDKGLKQIVKNINNGRRTDSHLSQNETDEELYLMALLNLVDLKKFVQSVDIYETSIDDRERYNYRKKYIKRIDDLKDLIDEERIVSIQKEKNIRKDINRILNSKDQEKEWLLVYELYMNRYWKLEKDYETYNTFIIESSNSGIYDAHIFAMNHYMLKKEYDNAYRHITMIMNSNIKLPPYYAHQLLVFVNEYIYDLKTETHEIESIITYVKKQGYFVEKSKEGYFSIKKKIANEFANENKELNEFK